ncbi:MAG: putative transcription termination factor [Holophagaceae bacterium]|nr:putative transcription termination factor [Holophagaceae bacterium]
MNSKAAIPILSILLLSACVVVPNRHGGVEVIPILPTIVEVDSDNYYAHGGYHYFHTNDRWYYASQRDGERRELPRSHWPKETRHRGWDHQR